MEPAATSPPRPPRVAVVVVTWRAERWVEPCFRTLRAVDAAGLELDLIAVDNASGDRTVELLRRQPGVDVVEAGANLGYAGGNNLGIRRALERGADFVFLLNPDTEVDPGFLREALAVARARPEAGAVQSLLLLADDRGRVNSAGNAIHFLGLGWCDRFEDPAGDVPAEPFPIAYASGAAVLYRASALRDAGLLDEELFLYHEDLDLGLRLHLAGHPSWLAPRSIVFHHYAFSRNPAKYYFLERNRWIVLLKDLRLRTLAVLLPLLLAAEVPLFLVALRDGWAREKLRAWGWFLRPRAWAHLRRERRAVAARRRLPDAAVARLWRSELDHALAGPVMRRIADPLLGLAWRLARPLLGSPGPSPRC